MLLFFVEVGALISLALVCHVQYSLDLDGLLCELHPQQSIPVPLMNAIPLKLAAVRIPIGWPMSAKVMRKWFSGELNYADTDIGARYGENQNGLPFPKSMIDTTMFKMKWILGFDRANKKYEKLKSEDIYSAPAVSAIKEIFSRRQPSPYCGDGWRLCGGDTSKYHKEFQFQRTLIDGDNSDKLSMFLKGVAASDGLLMDDLYGSLGAFTLNAAIGNFDYWWAGYNRVCVEVSSVSLCMRDVFTFHDRREVRLGVERGSQYLGHWNKYGFIIVPSATEIGEVSTGSWHLGPVARRGMISERDVYYPVRNVDYRTWQINHKQGGDLILYSDRIKVSLVKPVVVEFDL